MFAVVYEATVVGGTPAPDDEETDAVEWVAPEDLPTLDLGPFARATFEALGLL